jgi:XTP/dITP diphosphohydrolase
VVFHARLAQERTDGTGYTIDDVADGIIGKLTRRHPHVFGDVTVSGPDEVKQNWDAIKAAERAAAAEGPVSALDGVPMSQPALSLAAQLLRRAARAGAPAELAALDGTGLDSTAPYGAPREGRGPAVSEPGGTEPAVSELGRQLFALAAQAQSAGLDPELELRAAARAYASRVRDWEADR